MACIYPKRGSVRLRVVRGLSERLAPPEREDGHLRTMGVAVLYAGMEGGTMAPSRRSPGKTSPGLR